MNYSVGSWTQTTTLKLTGILWTPKQSVKTVSCVYYNTKSSIWHLWVISLVRNGSIASPHTLLHIMKWGFNFSSLFSLFISIRACTNGMVTPFLLTNASSTSPHIWISYNKRDILNIKFSKDAKNEQNS